MEARAVLQLDVPARVAELALSGTVLPVPRRPVSSPRCTSSVIIGSPVVGPAGARRTEFLCFFRGLFGDATFTFFLLKLVFASL